MVPIHSVDFPYLNIGVYFGDKTKSYEENNRCAFCSF